MDGPFGSLEGLKRSTALNRQMRARFCLDPAQARGRSQHLDHGALNAEADKMLCPGALSNRVQGPGGDVRAKRALEQTHEHRALGARHVGGEDLRAGERKNARTVLLDG